MDRDNDAAIPNPGERDDDIHSPGVADAPPALPATDEVQRVETERVDGTRQSHRFGKSAQNGGFSFHFASIGPDGIRTSSSSSSPLPLPKAPTIATWICLVLAWLFLGSRVPFTVFLGIPFDLAALLLAAVCLTRGALFTGLSVLALGTAGSLVVYLVGLFRFFAYIG